MPSLDDINRIRAIAAAHRDISERMLELSTMLEDANRPSQALERKRISKQHWATAIGYEEEAQDMADALEAKSC